MFSALDIFCDPNGVAYSSFDKTGHGFTQVYLNYDLTEKGGRSAFPEIIASMIERSFEQLGLLTRFSGTIKVPADKMYGVNFIIPAGAQKCQFSPSGTWSVFSKNENSIVTSAAGTAPTKANGKVINSLTGDLVFWQKGKYQILDRLMQIDTTPGEVIELSLDNGTGGTDFYYKNSGEIYENWMCGVAETIPDPLHIKLQDNFDGTTLDTSKWSSGSMPIRRRSYVCR